MTSFLSLRRLVALGCATILTQAAFATQGLSPEESDTIVKEDIAAAHVMYEICPSVLKTNIDFKTKIIEITQPFLSDLSDKTMTLDKLLADAEYKKLLEQAREDAKQTDLAEKESVCQELVNL